MRKVSEPRRRKSRIYEKWYGRAYTIKTLAEVKVCAKCGKELPEGQASRECPYCGGPLITKCVPKEKE